MSHQRQSPLGDSLAMVNFEPATSVGDAVTFDDLLEREMPLIAFGAD